MSNTFQILFSQPVDNRCYGDSEGFPRHEVDGNEPVAYASLVISTPLLMLVGDNDVLCGTDLQLDAYQLAKEPKKLVMKDVGHFDAYEGEGSRSASSLKSSF